MDTEIRQHVFGNCIKDEQIVTAWAQGYCTMAYPGENFPVLLPNEKSSVKGQIVIAPSEEALARMAFYEGDEYGIDSVEVSTERHGKLVAKYNKVFEQGLVFEQSWSFAEWQMTERDALIKSTKLYMERCWGKMTIEEADAVWQEIQQLHRNVPVT